MNHKDFLFNLPPECRNLKIAPGKKISLTSFFLKSEIWVVLLTNMPGKADKAWKITYKEFRSLEPKHGSKKNWIRYNMVPVITGAKNPPKPIQTLLSF